MPVVRGDVAAPSWQLSDEGRVAAAALAARPVFDGVRAVGSSPEPKAVATAEPIATRLGLEVALDADLRESERPEPFPLLPRAEHEALVGRWLAGDELEGWEPRASVVARMRSAVRRHGAEAVLVSHGRALSALLCLADDEWRAMPMPAAAVADARSLRLLDPFA